MAINAPILGVNLLKTPGNMFIQKGPQTDGGNTFLAGSLVALTGGALVALATNAVLIYGQVPDKSHSSTDYLNPPQALFGQNHYVFDVAGGILEMNVGEVYGGTDVTQGQAQGAPQQIAAVLETAYGIYVPTTGTYAGYCFLDPSNTANTLFTVVGYPDGTAPTDYNGRVWVKVQNSTKVQP